MRGSSFFECQRFVEQFEIAFSDPAQIFFEKVKNASVSLTNSETVRAMFVAEKAARDANVAPGNIDSFFSKPSSGLVVSKEAKGTARTISRVATVLYGAATNTPLEILGSKLHAGYITSQGGVRVDTSKTPLEPMLRAVFKVVNDLICTSVCASPVGCVAVDGWSTASGFPVFGMVILFVDSTWRLQTLPLGLIRTQEMAKTSENLCDLMRINFQERERAKELPCSHNVIGQRSVNASSS